MKTPRNNTPHCQRRSAKNRPQDPGNRQVPARRGPAFEHRTDPATLAALAALAPKPGWFPQEGQAFSAYLCPKGLEAEVLEELGGTRAVTAALGRLLVVEGPARPCHFAADVWPRVLPVAFESVGQAAKSLRQLGRNWVHHPFAETGRAGLIADALPPIRFKPVVFPNPIPKSPLGAFTLLDRNRLLACPACQSPFPLGVPSFQEDKSGPPNRAYLKLWEALTLMGVYPGPGERCLEIGASPGGWTFVLARLGARVTAVDKAPLDPGVQAMPGVDFRAGSAFALDPEDFPDLDWFFSDVICYPDKLHALLDRFVRQGRVRHVVATLKFQGGIDFEAMGLFQAMPGGRLVHLHHNKHELTFLWTRPETGADAGAA